METIEIGSIRPIEGTEYVARPMTEYNHRTLRTETLGWWVDGLGQFDTEAEALAAIEAAG